MVNLGTIDDLPWEVYEEYEDEEYDEETDDYIPVGEVTQYLAIHTHGPDSITNTNELGAYYRGGPAMTIVPMEPMQATGRYRYAPCLHRLRANPATP